MALHINSFISQEVAKKQSLTIYQQSVVVAIQVNSMTCRLHLNLTLIITSV